jgi:hypothetical protein
MFFWWCYWIMFNWWCYWKQHFFCFGDVIGVELVWWLYINLQSNKVIVFGQISQTCIATLQISCPIVRQRKISLTIKFEAAGSRWPEGSWCWCFFSCAACCWLYAVHAWWGLFCNRIVPCPRFAKMRDACLRKCVFFFWRETYTCMSFLTCVQVHNSEKNLHIVGLVQNWDASCMLRYFLSGFQMGYDMGLGVCWLDTT